MVSRNREWGLLGRDKSKQEQREDPGPVQASDDTAYIYLVLSKI